MSRRVLLTGGNGFVGSHILRQLLDRGFSVCCTIRTQAKGEKILNDFATQQSQIDVTIVPNIVEPEAYDAVFRDSSFDTVFHTASPFTYVSGATAETNNLQFLEPAIKGTLNLLHAVKNHAPTVKRIIWTGSCASVVDYDCLVSDPPRVYDENDWNPISWDEAVNGEQSKAYRASKKFAELEAWAFMKNEKPHFDLVTLCPPATFGPLRHSISSIQDLNESNARLWKACFDSSKDAPVPYIPVHTYVDVQGQRTPLGKPGTSSLPPGAYSIDNAKVKAVLGVEFRSLEETVLDVARCLLGIERIEKA
ncbi:hypothetical protein B0T22DRAFT_490681 [Podospora appendiculata]|uniref:NAD-dependent epimerase/dehydratase domain-containing protein n=1 Tax=Podospora appendiculata TaxID=314037 RepID=A0AAE0XB28_9PEZI|nr:hypothetical protein B0T22DRAFT_490681 [Podospora appendiculata]